MAKLSNVFENSKDQQEISGDKSSKFKQLNALQQSLAIVRTIEKLKTKGITITKKAELDYLLAKQVLEKADIDPEKILALKSDISSTNENSIEDSVPQTENQDNQPIKRNPQEHPKEFKKALAQSRKTVAEVEELLKQNKPVAVQQMELYELCKKFLKKFT